MIRTMLGMLVTLCCLSQALAQAIYSNIPPVLAGNYPSLGYQANQTAEFGDRITFGGTDRRLQTVTVTMSSWAHSEDYGGAETFDHPLTLNIYAAPMGDLPGALIATRTQTFAVPFRPTGWGFNGIAFNATFDFSSLNILLPDTIVYGLAYNTQTWGAAPIGVDGPYNSLNFALNDSAGGGITVGSNDDLNDVFWNTCTAGNYTDGGAGGVCTFRRDTNWAPYVPMAQFEVTGSNLELHATTMCTTSPAQLVVNVDLSDAAALVVGGQFFLEYDTAALDFVSAQPALSVFTLQVNEAVNEMTGTIDYATGVMPGGGPGATSGNMARITFNVLSASCNAADLVRFRTHTPPTRVSDADAQSVMPLSLADLGPVTLNDTTPPVITAPADITVKSDAGTCGAVVEYTAFATDNCNPSFPFADSGGAGTFSTGVWNVDRYAPCTWAANSVDPLGGPALHLGICNADRYENRPGAFQSDFYNTQGRQRSSSLPQGWEVKGELFIPASWTTPGNLRRSDLWTRDTNPVENNAIYPIVGFINNDPAAPFDPNASNFQPRFRVWDSAIGWIDLPFVPTLLDQYNSFRIVDTGTSYEYSINGGLVYTLTGASYSSPAGYGLQTTFVEAYNFGVPSDGAHGAFTPLANSSYDVYWKEVSAVWATSPVALVCTPPSGSVFTAAGSPHTVTCTATDACGNVSMDSFTVTVLPVSPVIVDVELADVSPGTYTRCITFQTSDISGMPPCSPVSTSATLTFTDGLAHAIVDVPCGDYDCITARDPLHTLRKTDSDDFFIVGTHYVANFTGSDALPGGNLNDDEVIDILDFGGLVGDFGTVYGTPSTTCSTSPIHADISGDGIVGTADFSFIQIGFLQAREANCCGAPSHEPPGVVDITIDELLERNLPEMVVADLNHDGRLNTEDVASFLDGARPTCPVDWNGDAAVTSQDLFHFLDTFFDGRGDFNRDRSTDSRDFFEFMTAFFRGC